MRNRAAWILPALITAILAVATPSAPFEGQLLAQSKKDGRKNQRQEDSEDHFKKWLDQDVFYIISDEERKIFKSLTTDDEREQFVEQFWFRRDPDPRTANNEFKEEHYRRIAYANERFASGLPGWLTDRGRIYIIHGPPAEIESRPSGGQYQRSSREGGGSTTTYPFEVWRYRYVEGLGNDVVLEFVDPTLSGEYRLALNPEEKDALLHVPGAGLTLAESMGLASKADRPYFSPGNRERYPLMTQSIKDNPFERYNTFSQIQAPPVVKYKDLKELVEIKVTYEDLPFLLRDDYYRLNESRVLTPVTIQLENKNLSFKRENSVHFARVAVYGLVTSITNRIITEFEEDLRIAYTPEQLPIGLRLSSIYQKLITLDQKTRYKLDLVVKDLHSGKVGVLRKALIPPKYPDDKLTLSTLVVSDSIRVLESIPNEEAMFVLGDVKIRPNLTRSFQQGADLRLYCQVYNAELDQTTLNPSLEVTYRILRDGEQIFETSDGSGESIQLASGRRVVLIKQLPVQELQPGRYQLQLSVHDRILNRSADSKETFVIEEQQAETQGGR